MDWFTVVILLLIGITLIIVELIFVPGTTIVGILGLSCCIMGVYLSFSYYGAQTGWFVLIGTSIFMLISLVYALRSGVWERFSNKSTINSKVNESFMPDLNEGDIGETISALRPIGKAEFNDKVFEVKTNGNYLAAGCKVKIIMIQGNKIIVEQDQN